MKKYFLFLFYCLLSFAIAVAQPKPKTTVKNNKQALPPSQAEMNKMMEEGMKGMNEEDKAEMRKAMKGIMPDLAKKPGSYVVSFTDNKKLVPAKDVNRINSIPKKIFTDADVSTNTALLYNKLMAKIAASEKAIITGVIAKTNTGSAFMEAAIIAFLQGHNHAAMGLAIKAVQADPKNVNHQNNLAAILSQSGYPEKAIPYLKKLSAQFPSNSTVLHNLGFAWLELGERDTARRFFGYAAARNPNNPETKLCRGVIEELKGDPKKAADHYVESFEHAPNPFTESMAKNVKAEGRLDKIDFEKLKGRITIYEYFKKDWIKIPDLVDDVSAYESNRKIQNGFSTMFTQLDDKIDAMVEASSAEIQALADKGETAFVEAMMKESVKGLSMVSLPAVYIQKILMAHIVKWQEKYTIEYRELLETVQNQHTIMTKAGSNDKCPDFDRKNNEFLRYANPLIRKFHAAKIEEGRVWLNAFCTWSWYITGNPKNTVMTQCIAWTSFLTKMYQSAMNDQYALAKSCVNQNSDEETYTAVPAIPNFTCPTVVRIPLGLDELKLSADAVNFDNNDWNIKRAEGSSVPNVTLTTGIGTNDIAEPGKYGNPYAKTGNGSISTTGAGTNEELTPLKKIMDELTPLSKIPPDELTPLDPALLDANKKLSKKDYNKIRNAERVRNLIREMMKTACPGDLPVKKKRKQKFEVGLGKLELDDYWDEEKESWINSKGEKVKHLEVGLGELELEDYWDEEMQSWINSKGEKVKHLEVSLGELEFLEIETNGFQTVINNGLEAIGTVKNFIKGLFD